MWWWRGDLLHDLHGELVVVGRDVRRGEDRGELVLRGRDLVVLGLGQDAELPELAVQLLHVLDHPGLDRAEVVVLQFLALGRLCAKERAARVDEVAALVVDVLVDEEVLLLRADGGHDALGRRVAEQAQDAHGLAGELLHGAQERGLLVQRLAAIGAEGRRDAQHAVLDEGVGGGVPGGCSRGPQRSRAGRRWGRRRRPARP